MNNIDEALKLLLLLLADVADGPAPQRATGSCGVKGTDTLDHTVPRE